MFNRSGPELQYVDARDLRNGIIAGLITETNNTLEAEANAGNKRNVNAVLAWMKALLISRDQQIEVVIVPIPGDGFDILQTRRPDDMDTNYGSD